MGISGLFVPRVGNRLSIPVSLISLLISGGVSLKEGMARTFVCNSGTRRESFWGSSLNSATLWKVQISLVQTARSADSQRVEPSPKVQRTVGFSISPVSAL